MAKPKGGKKYRLLLYEHMLNRWWPLTLTLAIILYAVVGVFWGAEWYYSGVTDPNPLPILRMDMGISLLVIASLALIFTLAMQIMRRMAYVQLFPGYLRVATPFLRMNISFKRIHRIRSANFGSLFPPGKLSNYQKDLLEDLVHLTAIVVDLKSYPVSRAAMSFFLSPYFFYDQSTHIVLLINDWMLFNAELESIRTAAKTPAYATTQQAPMYSSAQMREPDEKSRPAPQPRRSSSLLNQLNKK